MSDDFDLGNWLESTEPHSTAVEPVQPVLSPTSIRILNYCEQVYWESGLLPTPESVSEELSITVGTVRKAYSDETFRIQIAARGMDSESLITVGTLVKQTKALSPKQIVTANLMLNLHDKRSEREKLQQLQVSSQQYHAWLRQPAFIEFLRKRGEALFSSSDFLAYKSLINNVKAGDNKSLELFFRMRGIFKPQMDININIESVLQQVVEVISVHIKDPHVIEAIAGALENIIDVEAAS